jgi:hypothetical protein
MKTLKSYQIIISTSKLKLSTQKLKISIKKLKLLGEVSRIILY